MTRTGAALLLVAASFLSGVSLEAGRLNVRPEQIAGPLVLAFVLLRVDVARAPRPAVFAGLWLAAGVLGALGEPEPVRAFEHAARLLATALPVVLLPMLLAARREAERAWNGFLALTVLQSVLALIALGSYELFGTRFGITREVRLGFVHPQGTLLEPNVLGALAGAAFAAVSLRACAPGERPRTRLVSAAASVPLLLAVGASATRAAWIAVPAVLLPFLAFARRSRVATALLGLGAGAGALAALAAAAGPGSLLDESRTGFAGRVSSFARLAEDPNVAVRLKTYESALDLFEERPLLGAGHGAMERIAAVEDKRLGWAGNLEVHVLADTGLLGAAALAAFAALSLLSVARAALRDGTRARHLERLGALAVLLVCAQATETSWLASFWVLFGLALAAAAPRVEAPAAPTRVLYVHPSDELYGSDRVLLELVKRLDRARFEPLVALSTDVPYAGRLTRRLERCGVRVVHLRIGVLRRSAFSSPASAARFAFDVATSTAALARLARKERIALVHANTVTVFPAALAARLAGKRLLWHVHEIVTPRRGRALLHGLVKTLAHRVVVVSGAARASLGAGARAEVIPNGIEPRERAALPPTSPLVAYVGRLSVRKGPRVLLEAFERIAAAHPAARLVFAGDEFGGGAGLGQELLREAERRGLAGRVSFEPFSEDVAPLLARATVVVSPSILPESFGLVLLEAMASSRAVIASDHGGPRELVVEGETGFLVPPGDPAALASALDRVLSDPSLACRLGEAGYARARARFAIETTVRRFEEIYEEMARRG